MRSFCWTEARKLIAEIKKNKVKEKSDWRSIKQEIVETESSEEIDLTVVREKKPKKKLTYEALASKYDETGLSSPFTHQFNPKKRICESCLRELRS